MSIAQRIKYLRTMDSMLRKLAFDTRIGPKVFTANTWCKLLLSSLDRAVSADTTYKMQQQCVLENELTTVYLVITCLECEVGQLHL